MMILSDWHFQTRWEEISPGIEIGLTFDDLSCLLNTQFAYQEFIKIENYSSFAITLLVFRGPNKR